MKQFISHLVRVFLCVIFFGAITHTVVVRASDQSALGALQEFLETDVSFRLSDLIDFDPSLISQEFKKTLDELIVSKGFYFTVDLKAQVAEIIFKTDMSGKEVLFKVRIQATIKTEEAREQKAKTELARAPERFENEAVLAARFFNQIEDEMCTLRENTERVIQEAGEKLDAISHPKETVEKLKEKAIEAIRSAHCTYSILIGFPQGFKPSDIDSTLKPLDVLEYKKYVLIFSQQTYHEKEWNIAVQKGLNFFAIVKIGGPLQSVATLLKMPINEIVMQGVIDPTIFGSTFSAQLPGELQLSPTIRTTRLTLVVSVKEIVPGVPGLLVGIKTGLRVAMPHQNEPLFFTGEISVAPEKASLDFYMTGMWENVFGIPGPKIGNVKCKATIDYATAAATEGILTLSGFGIGGELGVGKTSIAVNVYGEVSATEDVLVEGELKGGLYLRDLVDFGTELAVQAAKMETTIGGVNQTMRQVERFKMVVDEYVPNIGFEHVHLVIAPKTFFFGGKKYDGGITVDGKTHIFSQQATVRVRMDKEGIVGFGSLSPFQFGPLYVSGTETMRGENQGEGPALFLTLKLQELLAQLVIDGRVQLNVLGGINTLGRLDVSSKGIVVRCNVDLVNQFKSELEFHATVSQPQNMKIIGRFSQQGLQSLSNLLQDTADRLNKSAQGNVSSMRRRVAQAHETVERAQKELDLVSVQLATLEDTHATGVRGMYASAVAELKIKNLQVQKEAKWLAFETAQKILSIADATLEQLDKGAYAVSVLTQAVGQFLGNGFNVTNAAFFAQVSDLEKSSVVQLEFDAIIAGKAIHIPVLRLDLAQLLRSADQALYEIARYYVDKLNFQGS